MTCSFLARSTSDNSEHLLNLYPGELVYNWQVGEISGRHHFTLHFTMSKH